MEGIFLKVRDLLVRLNVNVTSACSVEGMPFVNSDLDQLVKSPAPGSVRLCFLSAGRYGGKRRLSATDSSSCLGAERQWIRTTSRSPWLSGFFADVDLGDTMRCLTSTGAVGAGDLIVANAGLHYNDLALLRTSVLSLLAWHQETPAAQRPCTIWRETLPQHWNTADGTFDKIWVDKEAARMLPYCCKPLASMEELQHTGPGRPANRSLQKWNDLANPLVAGRMPILRLFRSFEPLYDQHFGPGCGDCTHWSEAANERAARETASQLTDLVSTCRPNY